jgi:LPXTG-motif cell wall-anchored protein
MRTLVKLVVTTIALSALVVLLAGPVGADGQYPPSRGAPSAPAAPATAPTRAAPTRGGIPFTGSSTLPLVWIGVGALALGGVFVVGARRQHQVRSRRLHA